MSRSNLIDIFTLVLLHREQFHEIDWFKSISRSFHSESVWDRFCSRSILVRNRRHESELIVAQCRSIVTRNLKRNCFEFSENIIFQTDFCIWSRCDFLFISWILLQLVMQNFFATMLDDNVSNVCHKKFIAAIADCLIIEFSICDMNLFGNDQLIQLLSWFNCCFLHGQLLQNRHLFCETIWNETSTIQCILIDFSLVLSNVNFLSSFDFDCIAFMRSRNHVISRFEIVLYTCNSTIAKKFSFKSSSVFVEINVRSALENIFDILIFDE